MVLAFERGMTSPMDIIVVVVSRPINVKVANIGTVLWATVYSDSQNLSNVLSFSTFLAIATDKIVTVACVYHHSKAQTSAIPTSISTSRTVTANRRAPAIKSTGTFERF